MGRESELELATVRRELINYCGNLPEIIKAQRGEAIGQVALSLGKCFVWIGGALDAPGTPEVSRIGEQLRTIGLEILQHPGPGDLQRTLDALQRQLRSNNCSKCTRFARERRV